MLKRMFIGLILIGCLSVIGLAELTQEENIDRPGMDMSHILLDTPDPTLCKEACLETDGCKAYTYLNPDSEESKASCRLKYGIPEPVPREDAVSGILTHEAVNTSQVTGLYRLEIASDLIQDNEEKIYLENDTIQALARGDDSILGQYAGYDKIIPPIMLLLPDLTVESIILPEEAYEGSDVQVIVAVRNTGKGSSPAVTGSISGDIRSQKKIDAGNGLFLEPQPIYFIDTISIPSLQPDEMEETIYTLQKVSEGVYGIGVLINQNNETVESDYTNNDYGPVTMTVQEIQSISVIEPKYPDNTDAGDGWIIEPGIITVDDEDESPSEEMTAYPDLTIVAIEVPENVGDGEIFPVTIEVKNIGPADAPPSKGLFLTTVFKGFPTSNPDGTQTIASAVGILPSPGYQYSSPPPFFSIPAIKSGTTSKVTIQEGPYSPGLYSHPGACVNIDKAIVESDYSNNNYSTADTITVGEPPDSSSGNTPGPVGSDVASQVEQAIFKYTNEERAKVGKSPYIYDAELSDVARSYSEDRLVNNYDPPDHVDKDGLDPTGRAIAAGYQIPTRTWTGGCIDAWVGENQAMMSGYGGTPDQIGKQFVDIWMKSSGHKAAIIDDPTITGVGVCTCNGMKASCGFQNIGIGVAVQGSTYKATQDFV